MLCPAPHEPKHNQGSDDIDSFGTHKPNHRWYNWGMVRFLKNQPAKSTNTKRKQIENLQENYDKHTQRSNTRDRRQENK